MKAEAIVKEIDQIVRSAGNPERAIKEKSYLKSPIDHYGASVPAIRKAVKSVMRAHGDPTRRQILAVVRRLWSSAIHEQRMSAVVLLEQRAESLEASDLSLIREMVRDSFTWAYVDGLAAHVAGPLIERHPELSEDLDRWAEDESFWVRRAAMLTLLMPLRSGGGDWKRFVRYADGMLDEKEFFIRKAIGWVLRETSKKRPDRVRKYVASRLDRMAGLTFREAVKRLPEEDREALKEAYEATRSTRAANP